MAVNGGWRLGGIIGRDATATVSIAIVSTFGAVKSSSISISALCRQEQSILSSLSNQHIISCLSYDVSDGSLSSLAEEPSPIFPVVPTSLVSDHSLARFFSCYATFIPMASPTAMSRGETYSSVPAAKSSSPTSVALKVSAKARHW